MYHAQSMRVGIFSDCYFPAINGVVTSIAQQVEILRDKGHQVDLYCPRYAGEQGQELGTRRLSAVPFPFHKREQMTFPWPPSVLKEIWRRDYDVIHIQTPFFVGLLGMLAAWSRGLPRVFHHHTLWEEYVDYLPIPKDLSSRLSVKLCRGVANACHGVVAPSEEVKWRFAEQGVTVPISVIPTGIRPERFRGGTAVEVLGEGDEVCLYIGRLAHERSLDALVRVFHRVYRKRDTARLWLVGDGPARGDLEGQVERLGLGGVVRFFGFVPRETLKDYVAAARLFLFASLTETQGLVVLEAQAGGAAGGGVQG